LDRVHPGRSAQTALRAAERPRTGAPRPAARPRDARGRAAGQDALRAGRRGQGGAAQGHLTNQATTSVHTDTCSVSSPANWNSSTRRSRPSGSVSSLLSLRPAAVPPATRACTYEIETFSPSRVPTNRPTVTVSPV